MLATRFGVSLENVVATSEMPASHQGTDLPEAKNSDVLFPDRLPNASAGRKQIRRQTVAMIQSIGCRTMQLQKDTVPVIRAFAAKPERHGADQPSTIDNERVVSSCRSATYASQEGPCRTDSGRGSQRAA